MTNSITIAIPNDIIIQNKVDIEITGPLGTNNLKLPKYVISNITKDNIILNNLDPQLHKLFKKLINNTFTGVLEGYTTTLTIEGVGYKVRKNNNQLHFDIGYSHEVIYEIPKNIKIEILTPNMIEIKSTDNIILGQEIAKLKNIRKNNVYQLKGIHIKNKQPKLKIAKKK